MRTDQILTFCKIKYAQTIEKIESLDAQLSKPNEENNGISEEIYQECMTYYGARRAAFGQIIELIQEG